MSQVELTSPSQTPTAGSETNALQLSLREWLVAAVGVALLLGIAPSMINRRAATPIEDDYRIPYALNGRYDLYQRLTSMGTSQFPALTLGDSVVWGQCAVRHDTLAHHLNQAAGSRRYFNAGLDGMHPILLAELVEHHGTAISNRSVLLQFNPLWFMISSEAHRADFVYTERPGLVPRLAAKLNGTITLGFEAQWKRIPWPAFVKTWEARLSDAKLDFLAWSLDHPYESPMRALVTPLPPSEDSYQPRLRPVDPRHEQIHCTWTPLDGSPLWEAFERLLTILRARDNAVTVLVGPLNEHILGPSTRAGYQAFKNAVLERLRARGVDAIPLPLLAPDQYADVCHPLGPGYAAIAAELQKRLGR